MLFNSIEFAIFFLIVFLLYWLLNSKTYQNSLLIIASLVFYGSWDWRLISLLLICSLTAYITGLGQTPTNKKVKQKTLFFVGVFSNLLFLGFFKYYNFFVESFIDTFSFFGFRTNCNSLNIILPLGISFYIFKILSYLIDTYLGKIEPTKNLIDFLSYTTFFPQLLAGPIDRADNLLNQLHKKRHFDYSLAVDGLRQILWGFFKKIVIGDNCAKFANIIFDNSNEYNGSTLVLGAIFFAFQIYGDFSGYSDISIGISKLLGLRPMQNFSSPYFSRDISEFWRRWHISLSTWLSDYVFKPLQLRFRNLGKVGNSLAILITFFICGLWHGAKWTFVSWGVLNAIYFLPILINNKNRNNGDIVAKGKIFPSLKELTGIISTFCLTIFAWIFFRAENLAHAFSYISGVFANTLFDPPILRDISDVPAISLLLVIFIIIEWLGRVDQYGIEKLGIKWKRKYRWGIYYIFILAILFYGGMEQEFIYFQF